LKSDVALGVGPALSCDPSSDATNALPELIVVTVPIPSFGSGGDLPLGVHQATLKDIAQRFGQGTPQRRNVLQRLERIYRIAKGTGELARFVVFGSFVTDKEDPNDVDVFMIMEDSFDVSHMTGEAKIAFDHHACDTHFGASVFWVRRLGALGGEGAAINYWQTKRGGGMRGIVEIIGD
jgi:hypothetical protein